MAKTKKTKPITGTGKAPDQLTVQKSNPLYGLWRSELTLSEFKILDTYLSRVNSHDPDHRSVRFEKGEIEKLLGVKKINRPELQERLKHLGTMVPVDDPTKERAFRLVSLFERAECEQDEDGIWQVDLTCTPSALKYIFNVDQIGYFRYKLRVVTSLRSRYAYILFLYLEKNRHMHLSWEIPVDELRDLLKADSETYQQFKRFNDLILKPVQKELSDKTDCKFTYEPVKKGRSVKTVRFTLKPLTNSDVLPGQMSIMDFPEWLPDELPDAGVNADLRLYSDACKHEFTPEEMGQLAELLNVVPERLLPTDTPVDSVELRRYHYLAERYAAMNVYKPKHRFKYLVQMIRDDVSGS